MVAGLEAAIHPEIYSIAASCRCGEVQHAEEKKGFSDVSNSSWMYKYVMKIATLGFAEL